MIRKKRPLLLSALISVAFVGCGSPDPSAGNPILPSATAAINFAGLRGINHGHNWYPELRDEALQGIRSWGANSARIVLSDGCSGEWPRNQPGDVASVISKARQLGFKAIVLEVHDTTGYGEPDSTACSLADAVAYWRGLRGVLAGQENFVIINIGNEPYGNQGVENWTRDTKKAVADLRAAGFQHALMLDAPNWGQDRSFTMRDHAAEVYNSDPLRNLVFSVHMYEAWSESADIAAYFRAFKAKGLPLVVGEFDDQPQAGETGDPDEEAIVKYAKQYGVGYFAWIWSGEDDPGNMNLVEDWDPNRPTPWGEWFRENAL